MLNTIIIIAIAVMLMMAMSVVLFVILYQRRGIRHQLEVKIINEKKQMELLNASLQSEEEERKRIAGELHDDVGATLSSVRLFLHQAEKNSHATETAILQQSGELIDESIRKIRDISHKLQPATLQTLGLYASLHALADLYNRSGRIKVETHATENLPRLPDQSELHIYRIIQELINNIIRHSHATIISIRISSSGRELITTLSHDGTGMIQEDFENKLRKPDGIGLKNISNRLQFTNGTIAFRKNENGLFLTEIKVPYTK